MQKTLDGIIDGVLVKFSERLLGFAADIESGKLPDIGAAETLRAVADSLIESGKVDGESGKAEGARANDDAR